MSIKYVRKSKHNRLLWAVIASICFFSANSSAQWYGYTLLQKYGVGPYDMFGWSVAGGGDVNGDGISDFIIGSINAENIFPGNGFGRGVAYVYSGADSSLLYKKDRIQDYLGASVAIVGDVNGDGRDDFLIGVPFADPGGFNNTGSAYLFSGIDGSLLFQENGATVGDQLGHSVAGAGDVNGDGIPDFIIGAPDDCPLCGPGSVYVYSGSDGSLLYQKNGAAMGDAFGMSVASAGDVNNDGSADFIIGAPYANPGGFYRAGSVFLYSGADGTLLYQKNGTLADGATAGDYLGYSVASAGDVNGDDRPDFLIGAPNASPGGLTGAGSVYLFSGADGSLLYQKEGSETFGQFGSSVSTAGDANGDGIVDFMLGARLSDPGGLTDAGSAFLYSGADGSLLFQANGTVSGARLGQSVAAVGDINGDGRTEFIIGAPSDSTGSSFNWAGTARIYSLQSCSATRGDMNASGSLTPADVILMLNCLFLVSGACDLCISDVNCSGELSLADIVVELNSVFLGVAAPC
ncbi:MAG: integrin alpha [Candidatus Zixiibacteriota bacterium]